MLIGSAVEAWMKFSSVTLAACAAVLASCDDNDCCTVDAMPDVPGAVEVARIPVIANRDVDLLFVIDDSPSMLDKQTNLKNAFPAFVVELSGLEGGLPNVHIGVISPDLGSRGAQDAQPGPGIGSGPGSCTGDGKAGSLQTNGTNLVTGNFISDTKEADGTRTANYSGTLANAFSAIASLGGAGCGFEQPLQAARNAIENNAGNVGFVRPNASLAIILVTDEDDCSMSHSSLLGVDTTTFGPLQSFRCTRFGVQCDVNGLTSDAMNEVGPKSQCHSNESSPYLMPVADYATYFKGLKSDPRTVLFAALIGDTSPVETELRAPPGGGTAIPALTHSCTYNGANGPEVSDPGVRIAQLASQFENNTIASVCSQDLSASMTQIARQVRGLAADTCLQRAIAQPPACTVLDETGTTSTPLPACNNGAGSTNKPCYQLIEDPVQCTGGSHLRIVVDRGGQAPAPNTVVVVNCSV